MQLMTEPKLEHRNHHLETHQATQQHYHLIGTTQDPLSVSAALTFNNSHPNQNFHQHHHEQQHQQQHHHHQQVVNLVQEQHIGTGNHLIDLQHPQVTTDLACQQQHGSRQLATSTTTTTTAPNLIINNNNNNNNNNDSTFHLASGQSLPPPSTTMNIQPTSYTKNHIINNNGTNMHLSQADELSIKKRREDLSRRPSYRKIFNDLTGVGSLEPPAPTLVVGQLAPPSAQSRQSPHSTVVVATTPSATAPQPNSSPSPQALDLLNSAAVSGSLQDPIATSQSPVSVVDLQTTQLAQQQQQIQHSNQQHHQQPHPGQQPQHHHLPANHLHQHQQQQHQPQQQRHHLNHHHHALQPPQQQTQQQPQQIHQTPQLHHIQQATTTTTTATSANNNNGVGGVTGATSPPITNTGVPVYEEVTKKRELRLQKNREAAKECRRKKKEYIKCLENRVALLENQNKALIDELKGLKDLYCKSTTE